MLWEVLGSAALGAAAAWAAVHRFPDRFRSRPLVLVTGPGAALLGGVVTRVVLGPGHVLPALGIAALVAAALVSVLFQPGDRSGGSAPGRPRVGAA